MPKNNILILWPISAERKKGDFMNEYEKLTKKIEEHEKSIAHFEAMLAQSRLNIDIEGLKKKEARQLAEKEANKKAIPAIPKKQASKPTNYNNIFNKTTISTTKKPVKPYKPYKKPVTPLMVNNAVSIQGKKRKTYKPYYTAWKNYNNKITVNVIIPEAIKSIRNCKRYNFNTRFNTIIPVVTYDLFYDYITANIDGFTRSIIIRIANFQIERINKNGEKYIVNDPCQDACMQLIKNNFKEEIYSDLKQEILCFFVDKYDYIELSNDNNRVFEYGENYIQCYKVVRRYLYQNKQRVDNRLYKEYIEDDNGLAIVDKSGKYYTIEKQTAEKTIENTLKMITDYASAFYTQKTVNNIRAIFPLMAYGYKQKEIAKKTGMGVKTIEKISPLIKELYFEINNALAYNPAGDKATIKDYKSKIKNKLQNGEKTPEIFNPYVLTRKHNNPVFIAQTMPITSF